MCKLIFQYFSCLTFPCNDTALTDILIILGALIGPYDLLLKFLSTCGCVQVSINFLRQRLCILIVIANFSEPGEDFFPK